MSQPLLSVRDLSVGFASSRGIVPAVDGVSFNLSAGETLALVGESGCGKTITALSLLRLLPDQARITGGAIELAGMPVLDMPENSMRDLRGKLGAMIFQEPATSLNPVLTVGSQIIEALPGTLRDSEADARNRAAELLTAVGIGDAQSRLDVYPFQMSGGMKQRVMIAMALAGEPRLLIADEPTTALDVTIQAQILELLKDLQAKQGMGLLLITHDLAVVAGMADKVGVMYAGQLIEVASRQALFESAGHPYTQRLFAALPEAGAGRRVLATLPGRVPSPGLWPDGCRFANRCPLVQPRCEQEAPPWQALSPGHEVRCHRAGERVPLPATTADMTAIPAKAPLLSARSIEVAFPIKRGVLQRTVGWVRAVSETSLEVASGETVALVGESGCGKTTFGKAVLQLIPAERGDVLLRGERITVQQPQSLAALRRRVQMVFQDPFASLSPRQRVGEIIAEGMQALLPEQSIEQRQNRVFECLNEVGLDPASIDRYPHEFSGGQRQRIAIARALAVDPQLLICDEPTSALDVSVQAQILNLLSDLQKRRGLGLLLITHNFGVVAHMADRVAVMYLGRIVESGPCGEVLAAPRHPYTRALLSAVPRLEGAQSRQALEGEPPSPAAPPRGCAFHPRCPEAVQRCQEACPQLAGQGSHQVACWVRMT